jgi:hypothetical protein
VKQFEEARTTLARQFGESSWKVARVDYSLAGALDAQGKGDEAKAVRTSAVTRINEQLPEYHPVRREIQVASST